MNKCELNQYNKWYFNKQLRKRYKDSEEDEIITNSVKICVVP